MKNFPNCYSAALRNFVSFLLVIDPAKRPSFHEIGKHEIFDDEIA
jgi:hypothetical protein